MAKFVYLLQMLKNVTALILFLLNLLIHTEFIQKKIQYLVYKMILMYLLNIAILYNTRLCHVYKCMIN